MKDNLNVFAGSPGSKLPGDVVDYPKTFSLWFLDQANGWRGLGRCGVIDRLQSTIQRHVFSIRNQSNGMGLKNDLVDEGSLTGPVH